MASFRTSCTTCDRLEAERGVFGAHMDVELVNDGPVTVMLEMPTNAST